AESEMQGIEEPLEEVERIGLLGQREALVGTTGDFLKKFVGRDMRFEGAGVPDLADEDGKTLKNLGRRWWELSEEEEITERRNMGQCVDNDVQVVILLNVVETHEAWCVLLASQIPPILKNPLVEFLDIFFRV